MEQQESQKISNISLIPTAKQIKETIFFLSTVYCNKFHLGLDIFSKVAKVLEFPFLYLFKRKHDKVTKGS